LESTPEERMKNGWHPRRYPVYHLVTTNGLARAFAATDRRLNEPQNEMGASISAGGSILFPDETLLLSADDRYAAGQTDRATTLIFEKDRLKLNPVVVDIKPVPMDVTVTLDGPNERPRWFVPVRYATSQRRPTWEMFVRGSDTQRVAVIPVFDTPVVPALRIWQRELAEYWPIIAITTESITAWDGTGWHTSPFQAVTNLPDDTAIGTKREWKPGEHPIADGVEGTLILHDGRRITGEIRWKTMNREYIVTRPPDQWTISADRVDQIEVKSTAHPPP
jgi:hypothetical protein